MNRNIIYIGSNIQHEEALMAHGNVIGFSVLVVPKDKLDLVNYPVT